MLFRIEESNAIEEDIFTSIEQFNYFIDKVIEENVSEMDCESPRSSTSLEIAEHNSPSTIQDSEKVEENDDTSSADKNEVNLPPGAYIGQCSMFIQLTPLQYTQKKSYIIIDIVKCREIKLNRKWIGFITCRYVLREEVYMQKNDFSANFRKKCTILNIWSRNYGSRNFFFHRSKYISHF